MSAPPASARATQDDTSQSASSYGWLCLLILFLVYTVHSIDRTIVSVLVEPIRREFDLSDSQIGTLTGLAYALPAAITTLPLGALIDRANRTRLLAGLLTLWSLFTGLGGLAANYLSLLATRVFVGAAEAGSANSCVSILSDYFPARQRPLAVSLFYLGGPAGALAGAYAIGAITAAHGWRTALFVAMVPGMALALVLLTGVREPARGAKDAAGQGAPRAAFRDVFTLLRREAGLKLVLLGVVVSSTVASATATWFTALFMRRFDAPIAEAGLVTGISFGLCSGLGGLAGGLLAARVGRGETRRLLAVLAGPVLLTIPVAALAMMSTSQAVFAGLMMLWAFLSTMGPGTSYSLCASLAPAQIRGRFMAVVFLSANIVANGFGPQIIGWLSDLFQARGPAAALSLAMMTVIATNLLGAAAFWLARAKLPEGALGPLPLAAR